MNTLARLRAAVLPAALALLLAACGAEPASVDPVPDSDVPAARADRPKKGALPLEVEPRVPLETASSTSSTSSASEGGTGDASREGGAEAAARTAPLPLVYYEINPH